VGDLFRYERALGYPLDQGDLYSQPAAEMTARVLRASRPNQKYHLSVTENLMSVKQIEKPGLATWSPMADSKQLIAVGSCAPGGGAGVSSDFSSSNDLQIYSLDLAGRGTGLGMLIFSSLVS
jgi:hypothetical protein